MTDAEAPSPTFWPDKLDALRQRILDWLDHQASGRSAQMAPGEEEATLGPWARIWASLIELSLRGPYSHMNDVDLSAQYDDQSAIFELVLGKPTTPIGQRENTLRASVLSWADQLASRTDEQGRVYITTGNWMSLIVDARTLAATEGLRYRLN
jgi:hypothetical protein